MDNLGNFIINFIIDLFDFIFSHTIAPILTFISSGIPNFSSGVDAISDVFDLIFSNIGWLFDFTGLSDFTIDLIIGYLIFKISALIFEKPIKLFFKYWETLI